MFKIDIELLKEHPQTHQIYGDDDPDQFNELVEKIKTPGWIDPILITPECVILSGHRRYKAAQFFGWKQIDVDLVKGDEEKHLEVLLLSNAQRDKTVLQRLREAELYKKIVEKKAACFHTTHLVHKKSTIPLQTDFYFVYLKCYCIMTVHETLIDCFTN